MIVAALLAWAAGLLMGAPSGAPDRRRPEVWMVTYNPQWLTARNQSWGFLQRHLDGVGIYINMVAFRTPAEELAPFLRELRRRRIRVAVECGYFDWEATRDDFSAPNPKGISDKVRAAVRPGVGEETARTEMAKLKALIDAYGPPDVIALDGPIRRLLHPGADTGRIAPHGEQEGLPSLDAAVEEVVATMRAWVRTHRRVRFAVITNFPNWGWKGGPAYWASGPGLMHWGDYYPALRALAARCKRERLPLEAIRCDFPFDYANGTMPVSSPPWPKPAVDPASIDWVGRIRDLEREVQALGLDFELVVNEQQGGGASSERFCRETLRYVDAYRAAGGAPRRWIVQTWYPHPEKVGPEDEPWTMAWLTAEVIRRVRPVR